MALEIRVLVVEDDPETRMLTEALLSGRKGVCLCALAKDGLEGLELVEQTRPDIVLLDLILPGMDGLISSAPCAAEARARLWWWPPRPRSPQSSGWPFSLGPATIS